MALKQLASGIWTGNAKFGQPTFEANDVIEDANLVQIEAHTAIGAGITGLVFRRCNLTNCDLPGDVTMEQCINPQVEFCSNVHPEWVTLGYLEAEVEDCPHVVDTDTVEIDGEVLDTIYHYEDAEAA